MSLMNKLLQIPFMQVQWKLTKVTHRTDQKQPYWRSNLNTGTKKCPIICTFENNLGLSKGDRIEEVILIVR